MMINVGIRAIADAGGDTELLAVLRRRNGQGGGERSGPGPGGLLTGINERELAGFYAYLQTLGAAPNSSLTTC